MPAVKVPHGHKIPLHPDVIGVTVQVVVPGEVHVPPSVEHDLQVVALYEQPPVQIQRLPLHVLVIGEFGTGEQLLGEWVAAKHVRATIMDITVPMTFIFVDFIVLSFRLWVRYFLACP